MKRPECANLMGGKRITNRLLATVSVAGLLSFAEVATFNLDGAEHSGALAQEVQVSNIFGETPPAADEQLLLESDELIYDNDRGLVIATGNVQLAYGRSTLVADKVEYNQQSGRVTATGNVEILEPNGNRIFAKEIDITDDFSDGFVSALNIQTADQTRIAAESAERRDGNITQFNNGVYTACLPCKENPEKPPFWQIRAKKVVINNDEQTVEYEDASFEIGGVPIINLPRFSHADPAIKRKSGFLIPTASDDDNLGFGYRQGYFFNLAPNYDFTVWGTYYSQQGFLGEAEWRHRVANGEYSIRYAGIDQQESSAFRASQADSREQDRHAVVTNGLFSINERWKFGWNALFQSDQNFARTYTIAGLDVQDVTNEVYLTGVGEKNYFDLRAQDFLVQNSIIDILPGATPGLVGNQTSTDQQASVLPILDYNAVSGDEFDNGQISLNVNVASIYRSAPQFSNTTLNSATNLNPADDRFSGIEGNTTRASAELEWKGSQITDNGLIITTSLSGRADAIHQDTDNLGSLVNPLTSNDSIIRTMPAAMMEIRYPLIASTASATHIFEPIAQVIARPDETDIGRFANEDAQSLVFDTTNLFARDKFSGFDRVEGGTRANVGFRYSASFESGSNLEIIAGQSFHLAGTNSFAATNDLTNAGEESGLETTRSDYVASLQVSNGGGLSAGIGVRLDEQDLGLKRAEVSTRIVQPEYSVTSSYIFTEAQPNYRFPRDRHEIGASASVKLGENWRAFGSITYDLETSDIVNDSLGLAYDDDCFSFAVSYANLNDTFSGTSSERSVNITLGLRTIGSFSRAVDFGELVE
ncbi:MAG: LPS-assembly protein LptD [Pseudomonadota bacterium]